MPCWPRGPDIHPVYYPSHKAIFPWGFPTRQYQVFPHKGAYSPGATGSAIDGGWTLGDAVQGPLAPVVKGNI
ncbi:hypothetical protein XENTR_v10013083 [Xenopus tropicalis]|nr:hypothetical protein XENTR_v10013083 [Xenopus tropicalis]